MLTIKSKTVDEVLDVIILNKKGTPEFTDTFIAADFKLTNKDLQVSKKNEFGTADPNAI